MKTQIFFRLSVRTYLDNYCDPFFNINNGFLLDLDYVKAIFIFSTIFVLLTLFTNSISVLEILEEFFH